MKTNSQIQLYPVLRVAIFLAAGIVIGDVSYGSISVEGWFMAISVTFIASLLSKNKAILNTTLLFMSCFLLGALLTTQKLNDTKAQLPSHAIRYDAVITSQPTRTGKVVRCDLLIPYGELTIKAKANIFADERALKLKVGHGIEAETILEKPSNFAGSDFDYARYLVNHGYSATTFIYINQWKSKRVSLKPLSLIDRTRLSALKFREKLLDKYNGTGASGQAYAVMAAMTLGDKSALSKELKDDYSISGASHVLALSGLHLGIIYTVLALLFVRRKHKEIGIFLIICAIWTYVFIVGLPVSAIRAAVMLTIYSVISLMNRDRMSLNALSVAAVSILVCNPLDIYDVGFQMSFMAVLFIFLLYKPLLKAVPKKVRDIPILRNVWQMAAVSISAQIGVAPLIALYFGRFSCYFLFTNFIAVPAATVIIYSAATLLAFGFIPFLGKAAAWTVVSTTELLNRSVAAIASMPGASIDGIRLNVLQTVLIYVLIACLYMIGSYVKKIYRIDKDPLDHDY